MSDIEYLVPHHQELNIKEAAGLLCVSRAFFIGLLEKGEIPYNDVGAHCQVLLKDVLAYKERNNSARSKTLDELAQLSQDEGMGY